MMVNLSKKSHTTTGVHMLQKYGDKYRYRCTLDTLRRATSVAVKTEYHYLFVGKDHIHNSELFSDIETGKKSLIDFIFKVCGVRCTA